MECGYTAPRAAGAAGPPEAFARRRGSAAARRCSGSFQAQALAQQIHCAGAVADLVLVGRAQFGAGNITLRHPEQRIVAKPVLATGRMQDAPVPQAFAEDRQRVIGVAHQRQHTDKLRTRIASGTSLRASSNLALLAASPLPSAYR